MPTHAAIFFSKAITVAYPHNARQRGHVSYLHDGWQEATNSCMGAKECNSSYSNTSQSKVDFATFDGGVVQQLLVHQILQAAVDVEDALHLHTQIVHV